MSNRKHIIHCFGWNLTAIREHLQEIKEAGFDWIQISPLQKGKFNKPEDDWWKLYQPYGYEIGNGLGTKEDLIELCAEADKLDIKIVADILFRQLADGQNGELNELCDKDFLENYDYMLHTYRGNNEQDRYEICNCSWGLPPVNYYNDEVRHNKFYPFLDELVKCGVKGFRFDMGKHFSLPEEGCEFYNEVKDRYPDIFIYSECIFAKQDILEKYAKYCSPLVADHDDWCENSVRFFESHDTYLTFKSTCWMDDEARLDKWMFLLSKYDNCLYYARPYDNTIFSERMKVINNSFK